ncbi:MAG: Lar family restriction alleviation protein [Candidatus Marsarchaeota archaeon]|jgi:hypothetical protein|nr:Lar family restriction alleviation protein [Candidatus Marsarchaeota archaeon]
MESESNLVYVSLSKDAARLDYPGSSGSASCIIERQEGGMLMTYFDKDGAILHRKPVNPGKGIQEIAMETAKLLGKPVIGGEYAPVRLSKPCPLCGANALVEHRDSGVPIIPIYRCESCGAKAFFLTDEYLSQLVKENIKAFSDEERSELDANPGKFSKELREYIIRIFASKRIIGIK